MNDIESRTLEYLLNSLWQVPLVFAAAWIAARMARRSGPPMEHRVWVSALLLQVVLPACHLRFETVLREIWGLALRGSGTAGGTVQVAVHAGVISGAGVLRMPKQVLAALAVAYACSLLYVARSLALSSLLFCLSSRSEAKGSAFAFPDRPSTKSMSDFSFWTDLRRIDILSKTLILITGVSS